MVRAHSKHGGALKANYPSKHGEAQPPYQRLSVTMGDIGTVKNYMTANRQSCQHSFGVEERYIPQRYVVPRVRPETTPCSFVCV